MQSVKIIPSLPLTHYVGAYGSLNDFISDDIRVFDAGIIECEWMVFAPYCWNHIM